MAADAQDLRYFYAARLGRTVSLSATDAASAKITDALAPGRYLVHFIDLTSGGKVWVRQGAHESVAATAAAPSFPMSADGVRAVEVIVRKGALQSDGTSKASDDDGIAAICSAGATCSLIITKISR